MTFESDTFLYDGPLDLTEYHIKHIGMTALNDTLRVKIVIDRRLLSLVLTAFIPTIILNIIGHMSNYFKEDFFEGLMSLNVTVMLVLTTMFLRFVFIQIFVSILFPSLSLSNKLPPTAYIKMMDVWLLFNLLKPFVDIMIQTYIETLRKNLQRLCIYMIFLVSKATPDLFDVCYLSVFT